MGGINLSGVEKVIKVQEIGWRLGDRSSYKRNGH